MMNIVDKRGIIYGRNDDELAEIKIRKMLRDLLKSQPQITEDNVNKEINWI